MKTTINLEVYSYRVTKLELKKKKTLKIHPNENDILGVFNMFFWPFFHDGGDV